MSLNEPGAVYKSKVEKKRITEKKYPGIKMINYKPNHGIFSLGVNVTLKVLLPQAEKWEIIQ